MLRQLADDGRVAADMRVWKLSEVVCCVELDCKANGLVVVVVNDHDRRASGLILGTRNEYGRLLAGREGGFKDVVSTAVDSLVSSGYGRGRRMRTYGHLDLLLRERGGGISGGLGACVCIHGWQTIAPAVQAGAFAGEAGVGVFNGIAARRRRSGDGICWLVCRERVQ